MKLLQNEILWNLVLKEIGNFFHSESENLKWEDDLDLEWFEIAFIHSDWIPFRNFHKEIAFESWWSVWEKILKRNNLFSIQRNINWITTRAKNILALSRSPRCSLCGTQTLTLERLCENCDKYCTVENLRRN